MYPKVETIINFHNPSLHAVQTFPNMCLRYMVPPPPAFDSPYSSTYFSECGMQQSLGFISHSVHIIAPCPLQCNRMVSNHYSFEYRGRAMQLFCLFVPLWIFGHDVLYTALAWQDWCLPVQFTYKAGGQLGVLYYTDKAYQGWI